MRNEKEKYTEEQIIGFLRQVEAGMAVKELCRKHGFSDASFKAASGDGAWMSRKPDGSKNWRAERESLRSCSPRRNLDIHALKSVFGTKR